MTDVPSGDSIQPDDLDAAVAEGIVSAEQASALRAFVERRERQRAASLGHEERFRFMRGFNDFFFAVGIALFAAGMTFFALPTPAGSLVAVGITWLLAELLVARLRLVLPGIMLACIFVGFVMVSAPIDLWFWAMTTQLDATVWKTWFLRPRPSTFFMLNIMPPLMLVFYGLVASIAAAVFYARFRLPFALLLIAAGLVGVAMGMLNQLWPAHAPFIQSLTLLGCGLLTFAVAMAFDMSDRERLTRRADSAFWLHLLAAPMIAHSLITFVTNDLGAMTAQTAVMILVIFAVLTVVAIVIDRRALLVSTLLYVGFAIGYGVTGFTGVVADDADRRTFVLFTTLLVLGTVVLTLGVGWRMMRRLLLHILPAALSRRLAPVATTA